MSIHTLVLSRGFIWSMFVAVILYGTLHSHFAKDYQWLQRTGNILALIGILATLRRGLLARRDQLTRGPVQSTWAHDPGSQDYTNMYNQQRSFHADESLGIALTILGLLIGSYADLLPL